jgi:coproporphyrinogen III oxidase-like Fe-S oxidoreductase
MKKQKIHIRPSREGVFTAKAKRAGLGVQSFARKVLAAPAGRYSASTRKQANFARNARRFSR